MFYYDADIEDLREEMNIRIEKFGIHSKEVLEISQIIDLLVNVKMNERD